MSIRKSLAGMYGWVLVITNWIANVCVGAAIGLALLAVITQDVGYLWSIFVPAGVVWTALGVCFVFRRRWLRQEFGR